MDDPFINALGPSDAVDFMLRDCRLQVEDFAIDVAKLLRENGFRGSQKVLVDRGRRKHVETTVRKRWFQSAPPVNEMVEYEDTAGWKLGVFGSWEPHIRHLYLLVDGSLAIDSIGQRKKSIYGSWDKVELREFPTLVPFSIAEIPDIEGCGRIVIDITAKLVVAIGMDKIPLELRRKFTAIRGL